MTGLLVATAGYAGYGLASQGWMIFVVLFFAAFGGLAQPSLQALISKAVPANEQGMLQGGLMSVTSLTAIIGPPLATNLFGFFAGERAPVYVPGASFFSASFLAFLALVLARRTFARLPDPGAIAPGAESRLEATTHEHQR